MHFQTGVNSITAKIACYGEYPEGYAQTPFYDYLARAIGRQDLPLALQHEPGKTMQVDYAGKRLEWVDHLTSEIRYSRLPVR